MYFTKIRLTGLSTIDLPLVDARPSDVYIPKSVDGLGPPEIDVSIRNTLNAGGHYQGRRTQTRELVFLIGLNPDYAVNQTPSDLRKGVYGLLMAGFEDPIKVEIMLEETPLAYITGYIKKLEIAPFSKTPEVQLTIACLQQYWITETLLYIDPGSKATPMIDNIGTAPAGFVMEVIFTAAQSSFILTDARNTKMQIDRAFVVGEKLIIDTRPGTRGIWVESGATNTNIIYALSASSTWFMLHAEENHFTTNLQNFNWGDVYYLPQYWGI
jgi:Phage tail protein